MEKWKQIPGYETYYSASSLGRIRRDMPGCYTYPGKIMKQGGSGRYARIALSKNGFRKLFSVHRLIAITFLGTPPDNHIVNHKNCNKRDNRIENLEWVTPKENCIHAIRNGKGCGSTRYNAKLNENQVKEIRIKYAQGNVSQQKLADLYNVSQVLISVIILRKRWRYI